MLTRVKNSYVVLGKIENGESSAGYVVEEGNNANGYFIRYSNGIQECWHIVNLGSRIAHGSGTNSSPYRTPSTRWKFPRSFSDKPTISLHGKIDDPNSPTRGNSMVSKTIDNVEVTYIQSDILTRLDGTFDTRLIGMGVM